MTILRTIQQINVEFDIHVILIQGSYGNVRYFVESRFHCGDFFVFDCSVKTFFMVNSILDLNQEPNVHVSHFCLND
jgi:hypothetical protein